MIPSSDQMKKYPPQYWDTLPTDNIHAIILPQQAKGGLYIGNIYGAQDTLTLKKHNINTVLTVQIKCPINYNSNRDILFHKVIPISLEEPGDLFKSFYDSYMFIENGLKYGNTLIHCIACTTISPVFAIAYLMQKHKSTLEQAWDLMKVQNPFAAVDNKYFSQLLKFERSLNLDIYLGERSKSNEKFREILPPRQLSNLEVIQERERKQKEYIQSVYQKHQMECNTAIDYRRINY